ncbi:MAG: alpha-IPM isomerase [Gemmatimonadaceae bacterium]
MSFELRGRARRLGDDINTDYIIASTRKRDTLDTAVLQRYLLETVDPAFATSVRAGDIIVAGRNFGCGSAMEIAATVILAAGINVVVAQSFARTFYRNAINNGLIPVVCDTGAIKEGDAIAVRLIGGASNVHVEALELTFVGAPLPAIMLEILNAGGLAPYMRANAGFLDSVSGPP